MKISSCALHTISPRDKNIFFQKHTEIQAYSKFKFGMGEIAENYAFAMKNYLLQTHTNFLNGQLLITSSAFKHVPTASFSIASHLSDYLKSQSLVNPNFDIKSIKINRNTLFENDYGKLSQAEREKLMAQNFLYFDTKMNLKQKKLLVIDDVFVTGSHENRVRELVSKYDFSEVLFLYIFKFQHIENPLLEHQLNTAFVKSLEQFTEIFFRDDFSLNARVCKFLLSYPDSEALESFLLEIPIQRLIALKKAIQLDGYDKMLSYQKNFQIICQMMDEKSQVTI